ncbi:MAG: exodeoxyribonuclease VII small subunit [Rickettsiales bacterium]|jgi:exodeoxyribonuclease VII small subunit|nr:exodeoxyribonuclease VII small subunit [Rickettsiales bacterium]
MTERELSFEEAMVELDTIVLKMERGEVKLAELVAYYERGARLRAVLEKMLAEAKLKIEKIGEDGATTPFPPAGGEQA